MPKIVSFGKKDFLTQIPSNESEKKNESILGLLKEILYNSLAQAIIKLILTPNYTLKIFLVIFVAASSGYSSFLVIQSIMEYFRYDVSTTSRSIHENPTLFPKITFCNVNWFTTEYAYDLTRKGIFNAFHLTDDMKKKLGHNLSEILIECTYNLEPCDSSHFIWSFDPAYGNCYTFNSGVDSRGQKVKLRQSNLAGPYNGLHVKLYVNIYEKLLGLYHFTWGLGALIRIGNSSYASFYPGSGVFVSPGTNNYLSVEREFKTMLPKPYSECEVDTDSSKFKSDLDLYNLIAQSKYDYTQQLCFSQCLHKHLIDTSNCSMPYLMSLFSNVKICDWNFETFISYYNQMFNSSFINDECLLQCPLECNQTLYKTTISSFQLIGEQYTSILRNNSNLALDFINRTIDATTARESFARVFIFYDSLSYTQTTESPQMNAVSLLGSIGGNLSLFLGVSFFSLCEIVEVVIEIYFYLMRKK
jgi:hypothetical protein